jgi:hypothetical protein
MKFCRFCGKEIHETAPACPHCGGVQHSTAASSHPTSNDPIWVPIASLVLGIISALALFDDSPWDKRMILEFAGLPASGLLLGSISINKLKAGKGMAISGVVLSLLALLACIGLLLG